MVDNQQELDLSYNNNREIINSGILGLFIGLAVIVPGISGSTIAIIFKLYDKLIYAMSNILSKFKYCFIFLLPIIIGGGIGFLFGFFSIKFLLALIPFSIISLFAGLMIGAFPAVYEEIKNEKKTLPRILLFVLGLLIPILIGVGSTFLVEKGNSLENLNFMHYVLFILIGYVVAITQVVPGLSATAILMALGYFKPLMDSVSITYLTQNPHIILVFACLGIGLLIGIVSFSKILSNIFSKNRKNAFFMIVGLSLGSIVAMFFNPDIYEVYLSWANGSPFALDICLGVLLLIVGIILAYLFVKYEKINDSQK